MRPTILDVQHVEIFRGRPGAAYSHYSQVTVQGDRLLATWSTGPQDEDSPGQGMLLSRSDDGGQTWSAPPPMAAHPGPHRLWWRPD